jgi:hypothetical protein
MAVTPTSAHGTVIALSDGASTPVFTTISHVSAGPDGGGVSQNIIKAFVHSQAGEIKRATYTMTEPVTFTVLYDSGDTTHATLYTAARAKTLKTFKITGNDTGAEVLLFSAFININFAKNPDGFNEASVTLEIDGDVTVS